MSPPRVTIQRHAVSMELPRAPVCLHLGPMPSPPIHQHLSPKPTSSSPSQPAAVLTASPRIHLVSSSAQTHPVREFSLSSGSESVQEVRSTARSDVFATTTGDVEQQMRRDSMKRQVHITRGIRAQHYARGMVPPSQQCIQETGTAPQHGFFMGHGFATLPFAQHPSQGASHSQEMSHSQEAHHPQETTHSRS